MGRSKALAVGGGGVVAVLAIIWSWYGATTGNKPDAAWFLVVAVVLGMVIGVLIVAYLLHKEKAAAETNKEIAQAEKKAASSTDKAAAETKLREAETTADAAKQQEKYGRWFLVLLGILWLACVVLGVYRILDDDLTSKNVIKVIADKAVYWMALACAVLVLLALPYGASAYVNAGDDQLKVARARESALVMVWCVLDVYTLYLVHEVTVIVDDYYDNAPNTTFGDRWHSTTTIPPNSTSVCDQRDDELKIYGLLYQDQVSPQESTRFTCAFELHEAIRLNVLCAVVAWTIYRISTHGRGSFGLIVTAMVFLALSTTVDDLRSYWVLGLEQAGFLSVAVLLEAWGYLRGAQERRDEVGSGRKSSTRVGSGRESSLGTGADESVDDFRPSETSPFLMPRPTARGGMQLDF